MERFASFRIGDIPCWAVSDGVQPISMHVDDWKLTAEPAALSAWFAAHGEEPAAIALDWLCLLAQVGGKWLLADTGLGPKGDANTGQLRKHLVQLGVSPGDIDVVFISHSHYDHIGGTLLADGQPAFPRARVVLYEGEREQLALGEPISPVLYEAAHDYLPRLGAQVEYLADGAEIVPGARVVAIPGHTTGHGGVMLRSRGERLLFTGDLFYHALQVEHPEWCSQFDLNPLQAAATRERIYRWASEEGFWLLPAHAALPGIGHIVRSSEGYRWAPQQAV